MDNLGKVMRLPGLIFGGTKGVEKVNDFFLRVKGGLTKMNGYQLASLEQQRKVSAMLFENLPFTLLVFAIKFKVIDCHELAEGKSSVTVNIALASTMLQVFITVLMTYIESKWLKEPTISYLMTKMSANNRWIPYIHKITKRDCPHNIDFGNLEI